MKKAINNPENIIDEMCEGFVLAYPHTVEMNSKYKFIKRKEMNSGKVCLISGGGSGHEPAHAGYVGKGMLDAAICGDVFSAPSLMQIYNTIVETKSEKGTLLIIKNYSGDCMNFNGAADMAWEDDKIPIEKVFVNDDVAVEDSLYTVGRRGVAGTVFVHKIAGAAAETGASLLDVKAIAERVISNTRSIGFALTSCTVPSKGSPTFEISDREMEFGVGIHGEPGISREEVISADELSQKMIDRIFADFEFSPDDEIALMVNGFGATPLMELYILNRAVHKRLHDEKIRIYKSLVGNFMTSLDMAGASLSFLKLDEELKHYLEAPADTPAFSM